MSDEPITVEGDVRLFVHPDDLERAELSLADAKAQVAGLNVPLAASELVSPGEMVLWSPTGSLRPSTEERRL